MSETWKLPVPVKLSHFVAYGSSSNNEVRVFPVVIIGFVPESQCYVYVVNDGTDILW